MKNPIKIKGTHIRISLPFIAKLLGNDTMRISCTIQMANFTSCK